LVFAAFRQTDAQILMFQCEFSTCWQFLPVVSCCSVLVHRRGLTLKLFGKRRKRFRNCEWCWKIHSIS